MKQTVDSLFKSLPLVEPRADLSKAVLTRIREAELQELKNRRTLWGLSGLGSLVGIVALSVNLFEYLSRSGFFQYLSLITSEQTSIITFSKTLGFTLLESIPIVGSAFLLAIIGLFVWSLARFSSTERVLMASA